MPTIPQLPMAQAAGSTDELPLSQAGVTRSVTVGELLTGTQPLIELASGSMLGRASLGPGGVEALPLGPGITIANASLSANGGDHASFAENSNGIPKRLGLPLLRGLFNAGSNISIDGAGDISASTDPAVTAELGSLTQQIAALAAKIPTGGFAGLNAQGQLTNPTVGPVTLGTVMVANGAPNRTVQARALDTINVVDFGAVQGGSDSSVAFNAAFAALPNSGGEIFVPAGDYTLSNPLTWSGKAVVLRGAGKGITRLHLAHTGIGFDIAPQSLVQKTVLRDFSAFAESQVGQTAAIARITYPSAPSFGYVTAHITDVECFGYPNPQNQQPPYPQTFYRGFVLNGCWSTQVNNVSWLGSAATGNGGTGSAIIEVNNSVDTRITGLQAYGSHAAVLQTGYCEGIYFTNPLIVGADYLFTQTDETKWQGYQPDKPMLLGLWCANGEVNINLGVLNISNVAGGFFVGIDVSRDGGPATAQTLFNFTDVSDFFLLGINILGGGANIPDTGISFTSTYNSSNVTMLGCYFANMTTAININNVNGTVSLTTGALSFSNVPAATAVQDNSLPSVGNFINFVTPATQSQPAGIANTKDHLWTNPAGEQLFRINNVAVAANYIRHQPATSGNPPTLCFDGNDGQVNGTIQTKGGNLYLNAAGGSSGSGNLLSLLNQPGATSCIQIQNATSGNLCIINTNTGGMSVQPAGALWLSPQGGIYAPNLPTTRPAAGSHQLWNNNGVVSIA